jgi:hypothetical protein
MYVCIYLYFPDGRQTLYIVNTLSDLFAIAVDDTNWNGKKKLT